MPKYIMYKILSLIRAITQRRITIDTCSSAKFSSGGHN